MGAAIHLFGEDGLAFVEIAGHVHVLCALAAEHEGHGPPLELLLRVEKPLLVPRFEDGGDLVRGAGHQHPPVFESLAPDLEGIGRVGQVEVGMGAQVGGQIVGGLLQGLGRAGGEGHQLPEA